jgi:hypothetical protein
LRKPDIVQSGEWEREAYKIAEHSIFSFCPFKISPSEIKDVLRGKEGKRTHREVHREKAGNVTERRMDGIARYAHSLRVTIACDNTLY